MLYGRKAKLPIDLQPQEDIAEVESVNPVLLDSPFETRQKINEDASKNILTNFNDFWGDIPLRHHHCHLFSLLSFTLTYAELLRLENMCIPHLTKRN